jgi:hypothetical protein
MKKVMIIGMLLGAVLLSACATKAKFPVSAAAPAADIIAIKKTNDQKNFTLEIVAMNLASPDRMVPPGANYSVWITTKAHGVKNVGQLNVENAKKTTFKTVTAFDFYEVFITVEQSGESDYPKGVELTRTKI